MSQNIYEQFELVRGKNAEPKWDERQFWLYLWQEFLKASHGPDMSFNYRQPIRKGADAEDNNKNPAVFLTQTITGIGIKDEFMAINSISTDELKNIRNIGHESIVTFHDNIIVTYQKDDEEEKFTASGLIGALYDPKSKQSKEYVDTVALEYMKAAMILAQNAKAAGWTEVGFGNTKDPAKRLALQTACFKLGLKCFSEEVDDTALPETIYASETANTIRGAYAQILKSPLLSLDYNSL